MNSDSTADPVFDQEQLQLISEYDRVQNTKKASVRLPHSSRVLSLKAKYFRNASVDIPGRRRYPPCTKSGEDFIFKMNSGQLYAALFVLGSAPCPGYGPLDLIQMLIRVRHQQEESIVHQAAKEDEEQIWETYRRRLDRSHPIYASLIMDIPSGSILANKNFEVTAVEKMALTEALENPFRALYSPIVIGQDVYIVTSELPYMVVGTSPHPCGLVAFKAETVIIAALYAGADAEKVQTADAIAAIVDEIKANLSI